LGTLLVALVLPAGCSKEAEAASKNHYQLSVTERGFEPQHITVKAHEPVTLVITRKTDRTCATELVIDDPTVHATLPLHEAVTVSFTPTKTGELRYGCAMDKMIGGVITVR
jgi:plastocyanin domain-containing protein